MATLPMAVYGLEVPAGDVAIPARPDIPAAFRITMAAIDPSAVPEFSDNGDALPRATLKLIREPLMADVDDFDSDDESDSDFDEEEMNRLLAEGAEMEDDESESDESDDAAGPSDPAKSKKARKAAAAKQLRKELESEMEIDTPNGVNGTKGKGKLLGAEEDDDEDDEDLEDSDDESIDEPEEFVICTLDPSKQYQQTLDITIGEDERVWFKVSGTHSIFLTGNYVEPADPHSHGGYDDYSDDDEDELDYDLSPDEDELDLDEGLSGDDLDDLEDPRITEINEEEEAPALVKSKKETKADKKGKNKRPAEDSADEGAEAIQSLDDLIAESKKAAPTTNGEQKLSKKQLKKLKNNEGKAVAAEEAPSSAKSDKKVQFAEKLEQGPTPSPAAAAAAVPADKKKKAGLGVKTVQGVEIDDKKLGTGPAAKKGDKIGMRYIGKLKDGKVFDSNKSGKPFGFKLGTGEVIKGWDVGVVGMSVGGERRLSIPAHLAYGSKNLPGIPANSTLIFDIKMISIK